MDIKFHSSGDAILSYCIVFSMYITLWNMERQSDTLLLLLYYSDFFFVAQYLCVKLSQSWQQFHKSTGQDIECDINEGDISLAESLPFFTTPISLLPFHVVFKIGLDRGCFYQFVCFLRLFTLFQDGRIQMNWNERPTTNTDTIEMNSPARVSPLQTAKVDRECQCQCRLGRKAFNDGDKRRLNIS